MAMPFTGDLNSKKNPSGCRAMNPTLCILAVACLAAAPLAAEADSPAAAFEGQVSFSITSSPGHTQTMDYSIKGSALRIDVNAEGHQVSQIMDLGKHELTILIHQQHMYMTRPLPAAPTETAAGQAVAQGGATLASTAKTEQILGYTCRQVVVQDKGRTTELWLAEGLGTFMGMGGGNPMMGGRAAATNHGRQWEELVRGTGSFPLRVVSHDGNGKEIFRMEATKIASGPQPDAEFLPPAGYQKLPIPGIGGMSPFRQG